MSRLACFLVSVLLLHRTHALNETEDIVRVLIATRAVDQKTSEMLRLKYFPESKREKGHIASVKRRSVIKK